MRIFNNTIKSELEIRWSKIQSMLATQGADACLISTNVNLLYVAGRVLSGYCYIPVEGKSVFFIRRPIGIEEENVRYIRKPEQIVELLPVMGYALPKVLLLEAGEITHLDYLRLEAAMQASQLIDATHLLRQVRSVKTAKEIELLKESARMQTEMFAELPSWFRTGMTDRDLAVLVEGSLRSKGCMPTMRVFGSTMEGGLTCVWAGENASAPSPYDFSLGGDGSPFFPVGDNGTVLSEGVSVMVDCGCNVNGYLSDQTRTFSVGKLSQNAYDVHQISLEIQHTLSELCKPGAVCEEIYQSALAIVNRYQLADCFMGTIQQAPFVGHGVGLVVNELPVLCDRNKSLLEVGNCIAIEPKFIVAGVGAVGTESTYVVRENGLEKLTLANEEIIDLFKY